MCQPIIQAYLLAMLDMTCLISTFTFLSILKLFDSFKLHSWKMNLQMLTQDCCADEVFPTRETICQLHLDLSIKHWFNASESKNVQNPLKYFEHLLCLNSSRFWLMRRKYSDSSFSERVQILSNRIFFYDLLKTSKICLSVYLFIFY